jgi:rubrerythrin
MKVALNAIEVFEIAEQIERNGAMFYRKAAELFKESDIREMFTELSDWEKQHERVFAEMKTKLASISSKSQTSELEKKQLDPKVMACLAVFGTVSDPVNKLKNIEKIADVLHTALEKEKDSITFYEGLKDFVTIRDDQKKVDDIINEEMHHIKILNQALKQQG